MRMAPHPLHTHAQPTHTRTSSRVCCARNSASRAQPDTLTHSLLFLFSKHDLPLWRCRWGNSRRRTTLPRRDSSTCSWRRGTRTRSATPPPETRRSGSDLRECTMRSMNNSTGPAQTFSSDGTATEDFFSKVVRSAFASAQSLEADVRFSSVWISELKEKYQTKIDLEISR